MSDIRHLLIPCAATAAEGCQQALQSLALPHLDKLLTRATDVAAAVKIVG